MTWSQSRKIAVVGVAQSDLTRGSERYLGPLTLETSVKAIEDAGLSPGDIDGFASFPRTAADEGPEVVDGVHMVSVPYMLAHLTPMPHITWHATLIEPTRTPSAVIEAVNALAAGACKYVLVWRASRRRPSIHDGGEGARGELARAENQSQFTLPYGLGSPVQSHALAFKRYMASYGARREHLGKLVVSQRRNAAAHENAYFRNSPLTLDEYMSSPLVADPLCLLDCDTPVSGAGAIVLTTAERARDLKQRPAYVAGFGQNTARRHSAIDYPVQSHMQTNLASSIWSRSGLRPEDVDVAQLYDEYSPSVIYWLEAAGFCKVGEGYQLIDSGDTELGGSLPVNTAGGQLGEGATDGMGHIIEAVRQVTGRAGSRQVKNASVSLMTEGSPMNKGAGLLFTDQP